MLIPQMIFLLESTPPGRVFGLDAQTLIGIVVFLINIGFLAFVLSRILYNPVRNFMQNRTIRVRDQINSAEKSLADANELKTLYEQKVKDIDNEKNEILDAARKLAADRSKQLLADAKNEADTLKTRAFQEVALERQRVRDEIREAIIDISADMAGKLITLTMDRNTQVKLFDEAMAEMEHAVFRPADQPV